MQTMTWIIRRRRPGRWSFGLRPNTSERFIGAFPSWSARSGASFALPRPDEVRDVVLDVSDVPPAPAAAPLLFLVRLLRRLTDEDVRIEVSGVTPALAAALTPFDMPDRVAITDTQGRRWPY